MKQNKEQKWYPTEYNSTWCIEDIESRDVLDIEQVGKEQAEYNAKLCASAPQWKEIAGKLYLELKLIYTNSMYEVMDPDNERGDDIENVLKQCEQLCKEQQ